MKVRSKVLFEYLLQKGVLNGPEEAIKQEKKNYRREYKQKWKKDRQLRKHELRPGFTMMEYTIIQKTAKSSNLKPTTFARQAILAAANQTEIIPKKDILLKVLQYISITAIELSKTDADKRILDPVETAEKMLLQYLFRNDPQAHTSAPPGL